MLDSLEKGKLIKLVYGIIITILLFSAGVMIFDDNDTNNKMGWLLIITAYVLRGIYDLFKAIKERNKPKIIFEVFFSLFGFGILIWSVIKYVAWTF